MLRLTPGLGKSICLRWALQDMSWTAHSSTLGIAGGRKDHSAVLDAAGSIWVFGGYNGATYLDELWKCDLGTAEARLCEPCRHVRYLCVARRVAWRPRIARSCRVANLGLLHEILTVLSLLRRSCGFLAVGAARDPLTTCGALTFRRDVFAAL